MHRVPVNFIPGVGHKARLSAHIEDELVASTLRREAERRERRRQKEIEDFWRWAPGWMEITGNSEEELLRLFPSYRGTKLRAEDAA